MLVEEARKSKYDTAERQIPFTSTSPPGGQKVVKPGEVGNRSTSKRGRGRDFTYPPTTRTGGAMGDLGTQNKGDGGCLTNLLRRRPVLRRWPASQHCLEVLIFEDANTRKFDESDSRRLGQRRKILQNSRWARNGGDAETRTGERGILLSNKSQQPYGIRKETKPTTGNAKIGKKEQEDGNRELDECLKGTHRGGLQGGRYGVIVYTHKQSKGTENRPAEAEQDQHRLCGII